METVIDSALPATAGGFIVSILMLFWSKYKPQVPTTPTPTPSPTPTPGTPNIFDTLSPLLPSGPLTKMLIDIIKQIASRPAVDRSVVEAIVAEEPATPRDLLDRLQKLVNAPCELSHSGTTLSDLVSNAQALKDSDPKRDVFVVITETDCSVKNPVRAQKATTDE